MSTPRDLDKYQGAGDSETLARDIIELLSSRYKYKHKLLQSSIWLKVYDILNLLDENKDKPTNNRYDPTKEKYSEILADVTHLIAIRYNADIFSIIDVAGEDLTQMDALLNSNN